MSKPTPPGRWFHGVRAPDAPDIACYRRPPAWNTRTGPPHGGPGEHAFPTSRPGGTAGATRKTGIPERRGNIGFRKERQEAPRAQAPGRRHRRRGDAALPVRGVRRRGRRGIRVRLRRRHRHRRRQGQLGLQGLLGRAHPRERRRRDGQHRREEPRRRAVQPGDRPGAEPGEHGMRGPLQGRRIEQRPVPPRRPRLRPHARQRWRLLHRRQRHLQRRRVAQRLRRVRHPEQHLHLPGRRIQDLQPVR